MFVAAPKSIPDVVQNSSGVPIQHFRHEKSGTHLTPSVSDRTEPAASLVELESHDSGRGGNRLRLAGTRAPVLVRRSDSLLVVLPFPLLNPREGKPQQFPRLCLRNERRGIKVDTRANGSDPTNQVIGLNPCNPEFEFSIFTIIRTNLTQASDEFIDAVNLEHNVKKKPARLLEAGHRALHDG